MDWLKILSAVFIAAMFLYLLPRARTMLSQSPKGSLNDWLSYIIPLLAVIFFVVLLIAFA